MQVERQLLRRVIAVTNGKGGVGKTSITANTAGLLAAAGYRVLAVDLDPQGNLSEDLGYADRSDDGHAIHTALLTGQPLAPLTGIRPNLDVCPGGDATADLAAALTSRLQRQGGDAVQALAASLTPIAGAYDAILIDCPPALETMQALALAASRWVLIPAKTDASSRKGLREVARRFVAAREVNPDLEVLGVVLFGVGASATRVRARAHDLIADDLGGAVPILTATIRHLEAAATDARERGLLAHELEAAAAEGPAWWELRQGAEPGERVAASAGTLAGDYQRLAEEIVGLLTSAESTVPA
jgi:chromosome partitioning protein